MNLSKHKIADNRCVRCRQQEAYSHMESTECDALDWAERVIQKMMPRDLVSGVFSNWWPHLYVASRDERFADKRIRLPASIPDRRDHTRLRVLIRSKTRVKT